MALVRSTVKIARNCRFEGNLLRCVTPFCARKLSSNPAKANAQTECKVQEQKGRPWVLFASPPEVSLACAVSADLEMHRGMAKEFKKTYENTEKLRNQNKMPGDVAVLNRNDNSFVYYLVTREKWWDQGTRESFYSSISAMRDHCIENGVTKLAVPRLGTAEDLIGWAAAKDIIKEVFHDTGVSVTAFASR